MRFYTFSVNKLKDSAIKCHNLQEFTSYIFEGIDKLSQVAQNLIHELTKSDINWHMLTSFDHFLRNHFSGQTKSLNIHNKHFVFQLLLKTNVITLCSVCYYSVSFVCIFNDQNALIFGSTMVYREK